MLGNLNARLFAELAPRAVLCLNHVLLSEPAATERLLPHQGKQVRVEWQGIPAWAGPLEPWQCRITPAGLFDFVEPKAEAQADLVVTLTLAAPWDMARLALQGGRPDMRLSGDSALAGELDWLSRNLRWDLADDLQRLFGAGPAQAVAQAAGRVGQWLGELARAAPGPKA